MRLVLFFALLIANIIPASGFAFSNGASGEKYPRVLVFQGGGFQTAFMLGMLEGAEKSGHAPDVVIGTCGGSVAAAIVNAFPNIEDQRQFIESRQFYNFLTGISFMPKNQNLAGALRIVQEMYQTAHDKVIPNIFQHYLMNVPADYGIPQLDQPLQPIPRHVVIVGGQAFFGPKDVGSKIRGKLFKEVFFTDPEIGAKLESFIAPIAQEFPNSYLMGPTQVSTDITAAKASRISISDMFYMQPLSFQNYYYLGGAIDLYPLELAKTLGQEVIFGFSDGLDTLVEDPAIISAFGYDQNQRLRNVNDQEADYWVDLTDSYRLFRNVGFNPSPSLKTFSVQQGVPKTYEDYVARVRQLWKIGFDRVTEALQLPRGDKHHIRFLRKNNSSMALRKSLSASR